MSHNVQFFQRSLALQVLLISVLSFVSALMASEPNYADEQDIEQAKKTVEQLQDRYRKLKNSVETALSDARRRHALQRNDATSVDPCELLAVKRDVALARRKEDLVRQVSKVLKDISPLIASAEELGYNKGCFIMLASNNDSPVVFLLGGPTLEVKRGKIVPPSASYMANPLNSQSAEIAYGLFSDIDSYFGFDKSIHDISSDSSHFRTIFIHLDTTGKKTDLAIRIIDNTVIARKLQSDGVPVEVTFPYSSRSKVLSQARQESRKIKSKQVPPELIDRQRRELRELTNIKNLLDELNKYIIKTKRMIDSNSDNLDRARQEIDNLAKRITDAEIATQKELVRIRDEYQQCRYATFTNSVGMCFTKTAEGNCVLTNDESSEEPARVTLRQWDRVIFRENKSDSDDIDQPVAVSRAEALKFCENLSRKEGRHYYLLEETKLDELQQEQRAEVARPTRPHSQSGSSAHSEDDLITFSVSVDADQSVSGVLNGKIGGNEDD
jgi:hypothetical protein